MQIQSNLNPFTYYANRDGLPPYASATNQFLISSQFYFILSALSQISLEEFGTTWGACLQIT